MTRSHLFPPVVVACVGLLAWQVIGSTSGLSTIGSPIIAGDRLFRLLGSGPFWADIAETARAFGVALLLAVALGALLGLTLGLARRTGDTLEPILVTFYSLPKVTLYPLVLLIFGLGISAKIAFGVMHGLVPIVLMTRAAILQLKPVYRRTAATLRMGPIDHVVHIVLPAILPELIAGIRIGLSLTLLGVLIGEMFASKRGLGFAAVNAMNLGDIPTIMAIGLLLAGVAIAMNFALLQVERRARGRGAPHPR